HDAFRGSRACRGSSRRLTRRTTDRIARVAIATESGGSIAISIAPGGCHSMMSMPAFYAGGRGGATGAFGASSLTPPSSFRLDVRRTELQNTRIAAHAGMHQLAIGRTTGKPSQTRIDTPAQRMKM